MRTGKVAIRVDSSTALGGGHAMRCLALAFALRAMGIEVLFLSRRLPGSLNGLVSSAGFELRELMPLKGTASADVDVAPGALGVRADEDLAQCRAAVADADIDWIVVDHYGLDAQWERGARGFAPHVLVIDDIAERAHDCDVLLNQNPLSEATAARYDKLVPAGCRRLFGPRYALLRPEFARARGETSPRDGRIRRILIGFGGTDNSDQTSKALDAAAAVEVWIDVVLGAANVNRARVERRVRAMRNATLHVQTDRMTQLMSAADLAIGAGGVSALERCCMRLPSIVLTLAANQVPGSRELAKRGAAVWLGDAAEVSSDALRDAIATFQRSPELALHVGGCAGEQADGRGAHRVARAMSNWQIRLRAAAPADKEAVYQWRNAEQTRCGALDPTQIAVAEHERWFASTLTDGKQVLLIGELADQAIGVLRYDFKGHEATISVYLVPGHYGQGLGPSLLRAGERWLGKNRPAVREIHAVVRSDNPASQAAFRDAGYATHGWLLRKVIAR